MFEVGKKLIARKHYYDINTKHILKEGEVCTIVRINLNSVVLKTDKYLFGLLLNPKEERYIWSYFDKTEYLINLRLEKINKIKKCIRLKK